MGLWDRIVGDRAVEAIEWSSDSAEPILVHRFTPNRIKYGALLTVHADQIAVMTTRGQVADTYAPGKYTLDAANMPGLGALRALGAPGLPFRAEVTFVSTQPCPDLSWATPAPIVIRDRKHGAIRLKASGSFSFAIADPAALLRDLLTADPQFVQYTLTEFRNMLAARVADIIHTGRVGTDDLLGSTRRLGRMIGELLAVDFAKSGISLTRFRVSSLALPTEIQQVQGDAAEDQNDMFDDFSASRPVPTATVVPGMAAPPEPVHTPPPAAQPRNRPTSMPTSLMDSLLQPAVPTADPKSTRIPLAESAPVGVFQSQGLSTTGPKSDRLLLDPVPIHGREAPTTLDMGTDENPSFAPPPLPRVVEFFVGINGVPAGPFDILTLAAKVREGSITRSMLVWKPGMDGWVAADTMPELQQLFDIVPPPLPSN
jgi:membrane protease subunit (stomatin/prohibitin family)